MANTESPSQAIKRMLEERNWTQTDLADVLGWNNSDVSNLIGEKKKFTIEVARDLAAVSDNTPDYWLDIHRKYELEKLGEIDVEKAIRIKLFKNFAMKVLQNRNWVKPSENLDELKEQCLEFFGIGSLDEKPKLMYVARKSSSYTETTIEQAAWLSRALKLSNAVSAKKFSQNALSKALDKIKLLSQDVDEIRHIPKILADVGIKFLIIEALPGSKIDGATFWVSGTPVIVVSLRFDRIDSFWHTLLHELAHVKNKDGMDGTPIIEVDLLGSDQAKRPDIEIKADEFAAHFFIPDGKLDHFISRVHPLYTEMKVRAFAARWQVHTGIVVGQLQHKYQVTSEKQGIPFSHHRKFLKPIRSIITESALTDGFGYQPII